MASSVSVTLATPILSVLILFSLFRSSISSPATKVTPELLKTVCSKAKDPNLCLTTLQNDPRSKTSDVFTLTSTYTDLAYDNVSKIQILFDKEAHSNNPIGSFDLTPRYKNCSYYYKQNLADLDEAKKRLGSSNNIEIAELAKSAIARSEDCVNVLKYAGGEYFPKVFEFNHKYNPAAINLESIVYGLALELLK